MILRDDDDPLRLWKYAERYLGSGTRNYSTFSADLDISPEHHPQYGKPSFPIRTFWIPDRLGTYLSGDHDVGDHDVGDRDVTVAARYRFGDSFLLPVHPDTLTYPHLAGRDELLSCAPGPPIQVAPSANARTVFVEKIDGRPVGPHFLKLHYPRRLSRFTRRLRRPIIELQLWVAAELSRISAPLLPEVAGGCFGQDPREAWGFVVRECAPATAPKLACTVPLFALYGRDLNSEDDPVLLEQLIDRSAETPFDFIVHRIVVPMVRLWSETLVHTGCALEPHGQNTLFTFSPGGAESRIVYRDCAVYVDPTIRTARGLSGALPGVNVLSRDFCIPREQVLSLVYDSFLGHHTLSYVARLAEDRFAVRPADLHAAARAEFARHAGAEFSLPGTVYYYDDQLHPDGSWQLVDTGRAPQWR